MAHPASYDVFISFSQKDRATAAAACAMLEANAVKCWIAPRDIPYGQNWGEGIMAGLNQSRIMVLIFSSNANDSQHVQREVERAVNRGMPIIPLRIENVAPARGLEYFLSLPNWLDAFTPPLEPYLRTLVKSVKDLLDRPDEPVATGPAGTAASRSRFWLAAAAAIVFGVGVLAAVYLWPRNAAEKPPPSPAPIALASPTPIAQPSSTKEVAVGFGKVETASAPGYMVAADPYLHEAAIPITVTALEPAGSRLVLINNLGLYEGKAVAPTSSQNVLTQTNTGNVPAAFTLTFAEPLAAVSFVVPKVWPHSPSGITFPSWKAVALSESGAELSTASLGLVRRFADVPAQTFTLSAPGFEGIKSVRFSSDPNLDGKPFAAFSAILIENLILTRP